MVEGIQTLRRKKRGRIRWLLSTSQLRTKIESGWLRLASEVAYSTRSLGQLTKVGPRKGPTNAMSRVEYVRLGQPEKTVNTTTLK